MARIETVVLDIADLRVTGLSEVGIRHPRFHELALRPERSALDALDHPAHTL